MRFSMVRTALVATALGTSVFSQGEIPLTPPTSSPDEKAAAQGIWDRMVEAKGGRGRLRNVETLVLEARQYLVFPVSPKFTNGGNHTVGVYAFPDRAWVWQDARSTVFGATASTYDLSQGAPQKLGPSLGSLLFQGVFMMQPAEDRRRFDVVASGELVSVTAVRNLVLGWFRDSRA